MNPPGTNASSALAAASIMRITGGAEQWVYELPENPPQLEPSARRAIADKIWKRWFGKFRPARASRQPLALIFLGATGAGKTTIAVKWAAREGVPYVDPDTITNLSPDFAALRDVRDIHGKPTGALNAHRERQIAFQLAEPIQDALVRAWSRRYDIAMQWGLGNNLASLGSFVADGYRLVVVWVATDGAVAGERAWIRAARTGRFYDPDEQSAAARARQMQEEIRLAAPLLARAADEFYVVPPNGVATAAVQIPPTDSTAAAAAAVSAALGTD